MQLVMLLISALNAKTSNSRFQMEIVFSVRESSVLNARSPTYVMCMMYHQLVVILL